MKKSNLLATLSWIVPCFCILLAAGVTFFQYSRYKKVISDKVLADQQAEVLQDTIRDTSSTGKKSLQPYVPLTKQEETEFLTRVKSIAQQRSIKFQKWKVIQVNVAPKDTADSTKEDQKVQAMPLRGEIEVAGNFDGVVGFVDELLAGNRLLCLDAIKWNRDDFTGQTNLSCTVTRFVLPDATPSATGAPSSTSGDSK